MNETTIDRSPSFEQWQSWLRSKREKTIQGWEIDPDKLIGEHNGESKDAREYQGREALELIQNANDAACESGILGRVRLELSPVGFIAANIGASFTFDGISSLRTANLSPKRGRQNMVGHKGLGFRAVLNWSRYPMILSGELTLAYAEQERLKMQRQMEGMGGELAARICKEIKKPGDVVVPLLAFPVFGTDAEVIAGLDDDVQRKFFERCRELRRTFDTVIGVPFDRPEGFAIATKQLKQLTPEVMLFANSIEELEIVIEGEAPLIWRRQASNEGIACISINGAQPLEWRLLRKHGTLPNAIQMNSENINSGYELVLAVPVKARATSGFLFSYFPTKVRFPFPLVCHATLDLSANRESVLNTPANDYVLSELASFLAETAEKEAKKSDDAAGLRLITALGSHEMLDTFKFGERLIEAAKNSKIIPTVGNGPVLPREARLVALSDTAWLPVDAFAGVISLAKDDLSFQLIKKLEVPEFSKADWQNACSDLRFTSIEARADFIVGILRHEIKPAYCVKSLLIDAAAQKVAPNTQVLMPPSDGPPFDLPNWCETRQLHPELCTLLQSRLDAPSRVDLATKLKPLGIAAYSLAGVFKALLEATKQRRECASDEAIQINMDLLQALYNLFVETEGRTKLPATERVVPILVASVEGSWEDVQKVYLGSAYGTRGRLMAALYGYDSKKLIGDPSLMGFSRAGSDLAKFFVWMGAEALPRIEEKNHPDRVRDFSDYTKSSIGAEAHFGNYGLVQLASEGRLYFEKLQNVDELGKVLNFATAGAILAWLALDDRANQWRFKSDDHGKAGLCRGNDHNTRFYQGQIPSYIRWLIQTTPWLQDKNGGRVSPRDCIADPALGLSELIPAPLRPTIEDSEFFGVQPLQWHDAFTRAGVLPSLAYLDPDAVYALLLGLPEKDKYGFHAKAVYQAVLNHTAVDALRNSLARERFLQEGLIWCRTPTGGQFCPIAEAWHVNSDDMPRSLRGSLKVADLPRRTTANVEAILGLRTMDRRHIKKHVAEYTLHSGAALLDGEIERIKPLFFELRRSHRKDMKESAAFKAISIRLCSHIKGSIEFQGSFPLSMEAWEWVWVQNDQKPEVYILVDANEPDPIRSPLLADTIGQVFASVFDLAKGDEFARIFGCRPNDRINLLMRMMGDDSPSDLDALVRNYEASMTHSHEILIYEPERIVTRNLATPREIPVTIIPPAVAAAAVENENELPPAQPKPLTITRVGHTPMTEPERLSVRVGGSNHESSTPRMRTRSEYPVTDGLFSERKVIEFEKHQGRFPLRVGHLQGYQSPGVDVLSFTSAEDRERFEGGDRLEELVERFIEVKGRFHEHAKIDLRDNALATALARRQKYWLYRLFKEDEGAFRLSILQSPIDAPGAAKPFYEINLDGTDRTERYQINGGRSEGISESHERGATEGVLSFESSQQRQ